MLEKVTWLTLLYDFYGQLLTEKQQRILELYYENDYSLGEIANKFNVSRQAIHDGLKRAEQMLTKYEEKLGLVNKFLEEKNKITAAKTLLESFLEDRDEQKINQVRQILISVMKSQ